MFPKRKRIIHLHVNGQVIRTTTDHPLYIEAQSWVNAGDMPGAKWKKSCSGRRGTPSWVSLARRHY